MYVLITQYTDIEALGVDFSRYPIVSMFDSNLRHQTVTLRSQHLNKVNIPIDIEKFDNNVRQWMLVEIVSALFD